MKLFNTLTKTKEEFIPLNPGKVSMYVCGQTTYDYCHLGHARKSVVFDMIRRWFIASGYEVVYVENITDIDDKIIKRAKQNKQTIKEITDTYIRYMHEDFAKLGILPPDYEPRATDYIPSMVNIIKNLLEKGFAYKADNGDVYYSVKKFANYGKLSGRNLEELRAGERVDIGSFKFKQDPMDFVLWKHSKDNEPSWNAKFGNGRPGWHIECSAMSENILGKSFDIHGGGQDLIFPHHENEIAQSEAHNECKFARYWLHNGFLNLNDEKMSKSLGNFYTLREMLEAYDAEVIRLSMLKTHYRSPLNFSNEVMEDVKATLTRLYMAIKPFNQDVSLYKINWEDTYAKKFKQAMDEDFNTPLALTVLFEMVNEINKTGNNELVKLMISLANTIGLLGRQANEYLQSGSDISVEEINQLIVDRNNARKSKNYQLADEIRKKLLASKIILEDNAGETLWRKE